MLHMAPPGWAVMPVAGWQIRRCVEHCKTCRAMEQDARGKPPARENPLPTLDDLAKNGTPSSGNHRGQCTWVLY